MRDFEELIEYDYTFRYGGIERVCGSRGDSWTETTGFIIMQFTGLLDKNGREIYEGDIVQFQNEWMSNPDIREIGWCELRATFTFGGLPLSDYCDNGIHEEEKVEILGNIHENPDLLKP